MNIRTVDYRHPDAGADFVRTLHETGFVVLKNHPISRCQLKIIYQEWLVFFGSEEINDYLYDPDNADGTQQGFHPAHISETAVGQPTKDLKEFFHVVAGGKVPLKLETTIFEYRHLIFKVGTELAGWIQKHTPRDTVASFAGPLPTLLSETGSLLRVLHYPPLIGNEPPNAVRAAPHEDINLITLLPAASQPGLQVRDTGGNWIDVFSMGGDLIVNSGDMLREATKGYFPSTTHQVINPTDCKNNESRISLPYFLTLHPDVTLSHRYTAGSYLQERLATISR